MEKSAPIPDNAQNSAQNSAQPDESTKKYLVPGNNEVIKSRQLGKIKSSMSRNQRFGFILLLRNAYMDLLLNDKSTNFKMSTKSLLDGLGIKHKNIFEKYGTKGTLEEQLKKLMETKILLEYKDKNGKLTKFYNILIPSLKINPDFIEYEFTEFIRGNILVSGNAYIMLVDKLAAMKSSYTMALFEQLEQRRDFHRWSVPYQEFRELLGVDQEEYPRIFDFKKRVLDVAVTELMEVTEYKLHYEQIKTGKDITDLLFTWSFRKVEDHPLMELDSTSATDLLSQYLDYVDGNNQDKKGAIEVLTRFLDKDQEYILSNILEVNEFKGKKSYAACLHTALSTDWGKTRRESMAVKASRKEQETHMNKLLQDYTRGLEVLTQNEKDILHAAINKELEEMDYMKYFDNTQAPEMIMKVFLPEPEWDRQKLYMKIYYKKFRELYPEQREKLKNI